MSKLASEIWGNVGKNQALRAENFLKLVNQLVDKKSFQGSSYLDIGGGSGANALIVGQYFGFTETYSLDLKLPSSEKRFDNINYIEGDARKLPFDSDHFDCVSLFSVIEHVKEQELALIESVRVLKRGGVLIIQGPNWRFPIDLHTGLLNPFYMPFLLRKRFLKSMGYEWWMDDVFYVSWKNVCQILTKRCRLLGKRAVIYPNLLVPERYRKSNHSVNQVT